MKTLNWIPVDSPITNSIGGIGENETISALLEGEIDPKKKDLNISNFKVYQKQINRSVENSLNVGGFFKGEGSYKDIEFDYLAALFSDRVVDIPSTNDQIIYAARYGFGFKVRLTITDIQGKINLNFAAIAASANLGYAKVSYKIVAYGIPDAEIVKFFPKTDKTDFNIESYSKIIEATKAIKKYISDNIAKIKMFPIEVLLALPLQDEDFSKTKSYYFAAKKLVNGYSLKKTIDEIKDSENDYDEVVAQYVYSHFNVENAYSSPNNISKNSTKKWLKGETTYNNSNSIGLHWIPISPSLTEDGAFKALSFLDNGAELIPHKLPKDFYNTGFAWEAEAIQTSKSISSKLKIAAIGGVDNTLNSKVIIQDYVGWQPYTSSKPVGGLIYGTRYGIGLRLTLYITNIEFGVDVNFANIAAVSELGLADVEYEITGIGINNSKLFEFLPEPQDININTFHKITNSMTNILGEIEKEEVENYNMQPFMVLVKDAKKIDPLATHQHYIYCYSQVAERVRLKDAVSKSLVNGMDKKLIEDIYFEEFGIKSENEKPSYEDKRKAKRWLDIN